MCLGVPSDLYLGICIQQGGGSVELEPCLIRTPSVAPTLAPAASERTVTTRAASSVIVWFVLPFCGDILGMSLIYVHQLTSQSIASVFLGLRWSLQFSVHMCIYDILDLKCRVHIGNNDSCRK